MQKEYGLRWLLKVIGLTIVLAGITLPVGWFLLGHEMNKESMQELFGILLKLGLLLVVVTVVIPILLWKLGGKIDVTESRDNQPDENGN